MRLVASSRSQPNERYFFLEKLDTVKKSVSYVATKRMMAGIWRLGLLVRAPADFRRLHALVMSNNRNHCDGSFLRYFFFQFTSDTNPFTDHVLTNVPIGFGCAPRWVSRSAM